jgi:ubiquinone/menaquinone biosynthesis C-methylase UbiE
MSNIPGNYFNKYESKNPIAKWLINHFMSHLEVLLQELSFESLVEVGCGEGYLLKRMEKRLQGLDLLATDISAEIIAEAELLIPEVPKLVATAYDLPLEDKSKDIVLACEVMEHVDEPYKLLVEAKRVARKHCIFSVPHEPWWRIANMMRGKYLNDFGNTPGHIQHWNKSKLMNLINSVFDKPRHQYVGLWQFVVVDLDS